MLAFRLANASAKGCIAPRSYQALSVGTRCKSLHHLYRKPECLRPVVEAPSHYVVGDQSVPGLSQQHIGVKNIAARDIKAGEVIFQEAGPISSQATMHSIQVGIGKHCSIQGEGRFFSHSFNPNCRIRIVEMSSHPIDMIALRDICEGESLSFDYTTNEWEIDCAFIDAESGLSCQGFRHLPIEQKFHLVETGLLPAHIMCLWLKELSSAQAGLAELSSHGSSAAAESSQQNTPH